MQQNLKPVSQEIKEKLIKRGIQSDANVCEEDSDTLSQFLDDRQSVSIMKIFMNHDTRSHINFVVASNMGSLLNFSMTFNGDLVTGNMSLWNVATAKLGNDWWVYILNNQS